MTKMTKISKNIKDSRESNKSNPKDSHKSNDFKANDSCESTLDTHLDSSLRSLRYFAQNDEVVDS